MTVVLQVAAGVWCARSWRPECRPVVGETPANLAVGGRTLPYARLGRIVSGIGSLGIETDGNGVLSGGGALRIAADSVFAHA